MSGHLLRPRLFSFEHFGNRADVIICLSQDTLSLRARVSYSCAIILNLFAACGVKSRPPRADTGRHDPIRLVFPGIGTTVRLPKGCSTRHRRMPDMIKSNNREKLETFLRG